MFKGIAGLLVVALVSIAALPKDVEAQKSSRIRVSVSVVSSVVPETHAAIDQQLSWLAQANHSDARGLNQQSETARRLAQISTVRLEATPESTARQAAASPNAVIEGDQARVRITVAYTAN